MSRSKIERRQRPAEYKLQLKADEILEITRCARPEEKRELVLDVLRTVEAPSGSQGGPAYYTSGFMSKAANRDEGACYACGAVRKMYRRMDLQLCCADCVLADMIIAAAE